MTGRYVFPDDRLAYLINQTQANGGLFSAHGQKFKVYLDASGTQLATDLQTFPEGEAITSGIITVDSNSQLLQFYGPSGVKRLWIKGFYSEILEPIYAGSNERLNALETNVAPIESNTFSYYGVLTPTMGTSAWIIEDPCTWLSGRLYLTTVALGRSVIMDVLCNGVSIFTSGTRPTVTSGQATQLSATPTKTVFAPGDAFTVQILQVGLTDPGAGLTYTIRLQKTWNTG